MANAAGPIPRPVVIDCDPGIDDAIALLIAGTSAAVRLLAVTTVGGNVGIERTTRNALRVLGLAGRADVPMAAGAGLPLLGGGADRLGSPHGDDGLGGVWLPDPVAGVVAGHAVDLLARTVAASPEPVTLVAIGPLTNVALFYAVHPELAARLAQVVVMGGSFGPGDPPEFNVASDPEAAYRVLTSPGLPRPVPTTVVGYDLTSRVRMTEADLGRLRAGGGTAAVAADLLAANLEPDPAGRSAAVHDAVALAQVVRPGVLHLEPRRINVRCDRDALRGSTTAERTLEGTLTEVAVSPDFDLIDLIVGSLLHG
jgi:pyrimidine-specific ribonucleoside hydrolase